MSPSRVSFISSGLCLGRRRRLLIRWLLPRNFVDGRLYDLARRAKNELPPRGTKHDRGQADRGRGGERDGIRPEGVTRPWPKNHRLSSESWSSSSPSRRFRPSKTLKAALKDDSSPSANRQERVTEKRHEKSRRKVHWNELEGQKRPQRARRKRRRLSCRGSISFESPGGGGDKSASEGRSRSDFHSRERLSDGHLTGIKAGIYSASGRVCLRRRRGGDLSKKVC